MESSADCRLLARSTADDTLIVAVPANRGALSRASPYLQRYLQACGPSPVVDLSAFSEASVIALSARIHGIEWRQHFDEREFSRLQRHCEMVDDTPPSMSTVPSNPPKTSESPSMGESSRSSSSDGPLIDVVNTASSSNDENNSPPNGMCMKIDDANMVSNQRETTSTESDSLPLFTFDKPMDEEKMETDAEYDRRKERHAQHKQHKLEVRANREQQLRRELEPSSSSSNNDSNGHDANGTHADQAHATSTNRKTGRVYHHYDVPTSQAASSVTIGTQTGVNNAAVVAIDQTTSGDSAVVMDEYRDAAERMLGSRQCDALVASQTSARAQATHREQLMLPTVRAPSVPVGKKSASTSTTSVDSGHPPQLTSTVDASDIPLDEDDNDEKRALAELTAANPSARRHRREATAYKNIDLGDASTQENKKFIEPMGKRFKCTICGKTYGRFNSASYHVTVYHRKTPHICAINNCTFSTREARYIHFHRYYQHGVELPAHMQITMRRCRHCDLMCKSAAGLSKHEARCELLPSSTSTNNLKRTNSRSSGFGSNSSAQETSGSGSNFGPPKLERAERSAAMVSATTSLPPVSSTAYSPLAAAAPFPHVPIAEWFQAHKSATPPQTDDKSSSRPPSSARQIQRMSVDDDGGCQYKKFTDF